MPSLFIEPGHENEDDTIAMKKLDEDVRLGRGGRPIAGGNIGTP